MPDKTDILKNVFISFISSESDDHVSDFMNLLVKFNSIMTNNEDLMWCDVEDVLIEIFEKEVQV